MYRHLGEDPAKEEVDRFLSPYAAPCPSAASTSGIRVLPGPLAAPPAAVGGGLARVLTDRAAFLAASPVVREAVEVCARGATWVGRFAGSGRWRGSWVRPAALGSHLCALQRVRFLRTLDLTRAARPAGGGRGRGADPLAANPADLLGQLSLLRHLEGLRYHHGGPFLARHAAALNRCPRLRELRLTVGGGWGGVSPRWGAAPGHAGPGYAGLGEARESFLALGGLEGRIAVDLEHGVSGTAYVRAARRALRGRGGPGPGPVREELEALAGVRGLRSVTLRLAMRGAGAWRDDGGEGGGGARDPLEDLAGELAALGAGAGGRPAPSLDLVVEGAGPVRCSRLGGLASLRRVQFADSVLEPVAIGRNHLAGLLRCLPALEGVAFTQCTWGDRRGPGLALGDTPVAELLVGWRMRRSRAGLSSEGVTLVTID